MELTFNKGGDPLTKKQDLIHLAILLLIALGIGVYLIITTVVITQDGVWYIREAMKFSSDPRDVIKDLPFGYTFLIFATHKLVSSLARSSSLFTWIYSAQSITLLCRLLALIPIYFIGKLLVGGKRSFWAIFVLIILPYPAQFASEVLREWPYILFLAVGFLFLLWGAKQNIWWLFGSAGFAAGLGHIIRPECAQLIIYGALWIFIRLFSAKPGMSRARLLCALSALIIGFAIPAVPYMTARGKFLPDKLKALISPAGPEESREIREYEIDGNINIRKPADLLCHAEPKAKHLGGELIIRKERFFAPLRFAQNDKLSYLSLQNELPNNLTYKLDSSNKIYMASGVPGRIVKAIGELAGGISENLMYFFMPALLLGIYFYFRKQSTDAEIDMFFVPAFAALNVVMLIALYYSYGYISRRHCLPLVVFTIFYVPIGLEVSAGWLANRFSRSRPASGKDCRLWFFILLITGTIICLPKLLRPTGSDKPGFRAAAAWLRANTAQDDLIASQDSRITFYAERKALIYETTPSRKTEYIVSIVKDENQAPDFAGDAQKQYSVWENERKKSKKIVIYKTPL
jgi:hypothetical protein